MPLYIYKALTPNGRELTREAAAPDEAQLRQELESQGLMVRAIRPKRGPFFPFGGGKVQAADFLQCNQELITLLKAGLTLPESLELVAERPGSPFFTSVLKRVLGDVRAGTPFSAACAKYPRVFDGLYLSSLKTGERMGNLASPLRRYQDYLQRKVRLRAKLSQALVYPAFLLLVLGLVLALLFTFVMPRFAALYAGFNATLPAPTRLLMFLVHHLPLLALSAAATALLLGGLYKGWSSTPKGRFRLDEAKQRLPLVSSFTQPLLTSQSARTLATLLSGGTPLPEALRVCAESLSNTAYAEKIQKALKEVLEGQGLSEAFGKGGLWSRSAVKLLQVGEASGQLEPMLEEIADTAEQRLEARLEKSMGLIEPVFILLTGLLIGSLIIVMYLPILHLADVVK